MKKIIFFVTVSFTDNAFVPLTTSRSLSRQIVAAFFRTPSFTAVYHGISHLLLTGCTRYTSSIDDWKRHNAAWAGKINRERICLVVATLKTNLLQKP